jgi:hypothetical protein
MVISDDDIDAFPTRACHSLVSDGSAVRGHDERRARDPGSSQPCRAKVIAVSQAVRDERDDLPAKSSQPSCEQRGRAHSIDVVVTVHENRVTRTDRPRDALSGRETICQLRGRVQML